MRQAIEGQIGMLTCQLLDARVQLQLAYGRIAQLEDMLREAGEAACHSTQHRKEAETEDEA